VPLVLGYYSALRVFGSSLPEYMRPGPFSGSLPTLGNPAKPMLAIDTMFEVVRNRQLTLDPAGVAENGTLSDAADAILADVLADRIGAEEVQARAEGWVANTSLTTQSLKAFCLTTSSVAAFASAWANQPATSGNLVGLAHGTRKGQHVWVVVLAS
jgi:hypothetical protein